MKQAFIRVDASVQIGSGHVMRCLTLAEDLINKEMKVFFITRDLPGNMAAYIRQKGYPVLLLPAFKEPTGKNELQYIAEHWQEDLRETRQIIARHRFETGNILLVVDHYALDARWERNLRPVVNEIMVIDDLANRMHDCDTLLDQNYYKDMHCRYHGLVPTQTKLLLGPKHVLLRPEFYEAKRILRPRDGVVQRILVFFGGSDPTGETSKALQAVQLMNRPDIAVDVIVGTANPYQVEIEKACHSLPQASFHCQVNNVAELIVGADLAVGAGGSVTWERCFLGLPALVITVADNQVETTLDLAETGAIAYLGSSGAVDASGLSRAIGEAVNNPQKLVPMSRRCLKLFE